MTAPQQRSLLSPPDGPALAERPTRLGGADIDYAPAREILTRATGFMDAYDSLLSR